MAQMCDYTELTRLPAGLYDGKMGLAIVVHLLEKYGKKPLPFSGAQILNDLNENLSTVTEIEFANGFAGIGWAFEWMAQQCLMEPVNTDDYLEDIDNILYRSVMYAPADNVSLSNGTLGRLMYFCIRQRSRNHQVSRYKTIAIQECIVMLIEELSDQILGENGLINRRELSDEDLVALGHTIIASSQIIKLSLNQPTVERILYKTVDYLKIAIKQSFAQGDKKKNSVECITLLCICGKIASKYYNQHCWFSTFSQLLLQHGFENSFNSSYVNDHLQLLNHLHFPNEELETKSSYNKMHGVLEFASLESLEMRRLVSSLLKKYSVDYNGLDLVLSDIKMPLYSF